MATNKEEAIKIAETFGYPIVLKIVSPDILHKTDAGGVIIGLNNASEVEKAYTQIIDSSKRYKTDAKIQGILVQKMAPKGTEIIIGGLKDPQFGQTLMFGLGGVFVEILKDVTFRIVPIDRYDAEEMIKEVKGKKLFEGFRNIKADKQLVIDLLLKVSKLGEQLDNSLDQLDLNPVFIYEKNLVVVDAKMILKN